MKKYCHSEVSYCLAYEESLGRAFSFSFSERMRSFQRTTCKTRQDDKENELY